MLQAVLIGMQFEVNSSLDHFAGVLAQGAVGPDRAAAGGVRARAALWRRGAPLLAGRVPRDAQGQEGHSQELQDIRRQDLRGTGERCLDGFHSVRPQNFRDLDPLPLCPDIQYSVFE